MKAPRPARVFLTGASSGIGLATAQILTAAGHEVWGTSRHLDRLPDGLPSFHPVTLDLNDPAGVPGSFLAAQAAAGGRFDVLVNNAGDAWFGPGADLPVGALRRQFETLTFGPFTLLQLALPAMRADASGGLVINVTSIAGRLHLPYAAAYNAAKAALSALTATLRIEEADLASGVHFVDVQPGDIRTGFNDALTRAAGLSAPTPAARAARQTLKVSDQDIAVAPPPARVAERILRLVERRHHRRLPAVVTVGMFTQAKLGPLAVRLLPTHLLHWTLRQHFGLRAPSGQKRETVPHGTPR